jgi:DNA-binding transcriptional MerR regulator
VAQLTGLDEHTIRAWERRHQAVSPARSAGGTRLYDDADVARLRLLRALTECGDPIGRVAGLSDDELQARLEKVAGWDDAAHRHPVRGRPLRVAAVGPPLAGTLRRESGTVRGLETVLAEDDLDTALADVGRAAPDALVVHLDVLGDEPARTARQLLERSGARVGLVVYDFARRAELSALVDQGLRLTRGPLRLAQLGLELRDWMAPAESPAPAASSADLRAPDTLDAQTEAAPEPIFTAAQIARLGEIASPVDCECPNHLSAIIQSLSAFERYSRSCESRSPTDAQLHRRLALGTGHARHLMERLLAEVCEQDGIVL